MTTLLALLLVMQTRAGIADLAWLAGTWVGDAGPVRVAQVRDPQGAEFTISYYDSSR